MRVAARGENHAVTTLVDHSIHAFDYAHSIPRADVSLL